VGAAAPVDDKDDLDAASSISATTSWISVRTMRFLSRTSVVGADQTVLRFEARRPSIAGSITATGRRRLVRGDFDFHLRDTNERPVPSCFKFAGDQAASC